MDGIEIKVERIRHGLRQYRLAAALGIPQTTLCNIESGRKPIPHEQVVTIRNAIHQLTMRAAEVSDEQSA